MVKYKSELISVAESVSPYTLFITNLNKVIQQTALNLTFHLANTQCFISSSLYI